LTASSWHSRLVTLITVALVGVEQGIGVAVGLAILDRTRLSARPGLHVLGRIPGTTSWIPLDVEGGAQSVPSVLVVLFATPLWYANAIHFRGAMSAAVAQAPGQTELVVLDALGMSDIDYTGSRALERVLDGFDAAKISFAVAARRLPRARRVRPQRTGGADRGRPLLPLGR